MEHIEDDLGSSVSRVRFRRGRIWYTKETERRLFCAMTLIMLLAGILYKTGVW